MYRCTECDKTYPTLQAAGRCHYGIGGVVEVNEDGTPAYDWHVDASGNIQVDGTEGQDRESYTDTQDRESYEVEVEDDDEPELFVGGLTAAQDQARAEQLASDMRACADAESTSYTTLGLMEDWKAEVACGDTLLGFHAWMEAYGHDD